MYVILNHQNFGGLIFFLYICTVLNIIKMNLSNKEKEHIKNALNNNIEKILAFYRPVATIHSPCFVLNSSSERELKKLVEKYRNIISKICLNPKGLTNDDKKIIYLSLEQYSELINYQLLYTPILDRRGLLVFDEKEWEDEHKKLYDEINELKNKFYE